MEDSTKGELASGFQIPAKITLGSRGGLSCVHGARVKGDRSWKPFLAQYHPFMVEQSAELLLGRASVRSYTLSSSRFREPLVKHLVEARAKCAQRPSDWWMSDTLNPGFLFSIATVFRLY